jgi:hypothetical protein
MIQIRESIECCMSRAQFNKYRNYERDKLKRIHEDLLKTETNSSIQEIIKKILYEI